jgi:general secretion pathway protein G
MNWTCSCGSENLSGARFCNQCGAPRPTEAAPEETRPQGPDEAAAQAVCGQVQPETAAVGQAAPPAHKKSSAPVVIAILAAVALLGVCLLGIIAAIAIPNLLNATQRAKQKRAMADMRAVAAACQSYATDNGRFPDTGHDSDSYYSTVDASALGPFLVPGYIQQLPGKDPWEHPYLYGVSEDGSEFILICPAADGTTKLEAIPQEHVGTHCFEDDIVWENSAFIQSPEGSQRRCR